MEPSAAMIKWITSPESKKIAASAQEKAWKDLQQQYPRADRSKFEIEVFYSKKKLPHGYRGGIFQRQFRRIDECFWLR